MAGIPESQLETWSHLGSVQQSKQTCDKIRKVLNDSSAPYYSKSFDNFLQGSYANDTNIYGDSDVDIIIVLEDAFGHDLENLDQASAAMFQSDYANATYDYSHFKNDVTTWLQKKYGSAIQPGKKAIVIKGDNSRRDADVLPCIRFRRYQRFDGVGNEDYATGICFWNADGTQIINYPEQHRDNCVAKHQATDSMFKPTVRILKNIRNAMIDKNVIPEGLAPSYYLEGLLYNVPPEKFGSTYHNTLADCLNWILETPRDKFVCANEQYYLFHTSSPVTWRSGQCAQFLEAAKTFWNNW